MGQLDRKGELVNQGRIEGIADIRDESDRDGMRVVIELKRDTNHRMFSSSCITKPRFLPTSVQFYSPSGWATAPAELATTVAGVLEIPNRPLTGATPTN